MILGVIRQTLGNLIANQGFPSLGILLFGYQLFGKIRISRLTPITATLIGLQVAIFMKWINFGFVSDVCLDPDLIQHHFDPEMKRFWLAPLFHVNDLHLYYNLLSFVWKGLKLEKEMGSLKFFLVVNLMAFLCGLGYVILSITAAEVFEDETYTRQCAVGFSSILFALKVILQSQETAGSWEDFGFFSVPNHLTVWTELFIIQLLVPKASLIGHLAGILAGLAYVNVSLPFRILAIPFKMKIPATLICLWAATALHLDLIKKPWMTKFFWSSKSSLVCINSNFVLEKGQWLRLISAPMEHQSHVHFFTCSASFFIKACYLERKLFRTLLESLVVAIGGLVLTSLTYVTLSQILLDVMEYENASSCVQGLSGLLFAMKTVLFYHSFKSGGVPLVVLFFELAESLVILEKRHLLYHLAGILVGLFHCTFSPRSIFESKFPGRGHRLGGRPKQEAATKSWGYAGQESRFREGARRNHEIGSKDTGSGGDRIETQLDEEADSSGTEVTHNFSLESDDLSGHHDWTPSAPPPPSYFNEYSNPPRPPAGGEFFSDEEEDPEDLRVLNQVDNRSPSSPTNHPP